MYRYQHKMMEKEAIYIAGPECFYTCLLYTSRLGICLTSGERLDGSIILKTLDFSNAPIRYEMGRSMEMTPTLTPWTTTTAWLKTFVSSADHFNPCLLYTSRCV